MFKLFKKKSAVEKLEERYDQLITEAFQLSKSSRAESDKKTAEANNLMTEIEKLRKESDNIQD